MSKVIAFTGEHLGHAATVAECEVTIDRLQAILDAAVITAEADSDGLYMRDDAREACCWKLLTHEIIGPNNHEEPGRQMVQQQRSVMVALVWRARRGEALVEILASPQGRRVSRYIVIVQA